jgi:hypothetical protein
MQLSLCFALDLSCFALGLFCSHCHLAVIYIAADEPPLHRPA